MNRIELLTEFIMQSDAIEGIGDNRIEIEERIMLGKSDGHVGALLYMEYVADRRFLLEEKYIKMTQALITAEQGIKRHDLVLPEKYIGYYRDIPRGVEGEVRIKPFQIGCHMHVLIDRVRRWQEHAFKLPEMENVKAIADFYFDFERIHPFIDGNGRTGRVIVFALMLYIEREPFVFTAEEKYWMHFPALKSGNREVMWKYFYEKSGLI